MKNLVIVALIFVLATASTAASHGSSVGGGKGASGGGRSATKFAKTSSSQTNNSGWVRKSAGQTASRTFGKNAQKRNFADGGFEQNRLAVAHYGGYRFHEWRWGWGGGWYPAAWYYPGYWYWYDWPYPYYPGGFAYQFKKMDELTGSGLRFDLDAIPHAGRKTVEQGIIYVDGAERGWVGKYLHKTLSADPGEHEVVVRLADKRELPTKVAVVAGHPTRILLRFGDKPTDAAEPESDSKPDEN